MKKFLLLTALALLVGTTGCKNKDKTDDVATVPAGESNVDVVYVGSSTNPGSVQPMSDPMAVSHSGQTGVNYVPPAPPSGGVGPMPTYTPVGAKPASHTVARGETLWSIAVRYYGDGKRHTDIMRANNISDPTKLRVGQQLVLP